MFRAVSCSLSRFEEIDDAAAAKSAADSKKRPRDSDAMETDEKLSKAEQKKLKKLKAASGEAVPAATPEKKDEKKKEKKKEKAEKEKPKAETKTVAGGVKLVDNKTGTGPQAKTGDMVSMRYIGKLENGKIFDQNTKGKPVCLASVLTPFSRLTRANSSSSVSAKARSSRVSSLVIVIFLALTSVQAGTSVSSACRLVASASLPSLRRWRTARGHSLASLPTRLSSSVSESCWLIRRMTANNHSRGQAAQHQLRHELDILLVTCWFLPRRFQC